MTRKWLSLALFCVFCLAVGFVGAQSNPTGQSPIAHGISAGGGGGGVSGLDTCDGGTAIADNAILRGDGTTGCQGSGLFATDSTQLAFGGLTSSNAMISLRAGGTQFELKKGDDTNRTYLWLTGAGFENTGGDYAPNMFLDFNGVGLSSGTQVRWTSSSTDGGQGKDSGVGRLAAGVVKITDGSTGGGALKVGDPGTRPTCDSTYRGTIWIDEGGAGVADDISICAKNSSDAYAWYAAATVP